MVSVLEVASSAPSAACHPPPGLLSNRRKPPSGRHRTNWWVPSTGLSIQTVSKLSPPSSAQSTGKPPCSAISGAPPSQQAARAAQAERVRQGRNESIPRRCHGDAPGARVSALSEKRHGSRRELRWWSSRHRLRALERPYVDALRPAASRQHRAPRGGTPALHPIPPG